MVTYPATVRVITHVGDETDTFAALPSTANEELIEKTIMDSFVTWACPPTENEFPFRLRRDGQYIFITYTNGTDEWEDENDGAFRLTVVPLLTS